jgi:hypothetical protein
MKITLSRETRNVIPGLIITFREGDATIAIAGGATSIVRGPIRDWLMAHLEAHGERDAEYSPSASGARLLVDDDGQPKQLDVIGWPPQLTPAPPAEQPPIGGPPPVTPPADVPRAPQSVDDWRAAIAAAAETSIPPLPPVGADEDVATYAARALSPLGLTAAAVAKSGGLTSLIPEPHHPSWDPIIQAVGGRPPRHDDSPPATTTTGQ